VLLRERVDLDLDRLALDLGGGERREIEDAVVEQVARGGGHQYVRAEVLVEPWIRDARLTGSRVQLSASGPGLDTCTP
jgi:hypothetical protein